MGIKITLDVDVHKLDNPMLVIAVISALEANDDRVIYDTIDALIADGENSYNEAILMEAMYDQVTSIYRTIRGAYPTLESHLKDSFITSVTPMGNACILELEKFDE